MGNLRYFVLIPVLAMLSTGCASRYQDLLADRDNEIRQLRGQLAQARADRDRLASENSQLRTSPTAVDASMGGDDSGLESLRDRLGDGAGVGRDAQGNINIDVYEAATFDSGSVELKSSASKVLREIASIIDREFPGHRIFVEGHTDDQPLRKTKGRWRDNRHLSVERADAVARWLIEKGGVPERQVAVVGFGPYRPAVSGSTDAARTRNRRVVIVPRPMGFGEQL